MITLAIGILIACGLRFFLAGTRFGLVLGLIFLSNGANLLIFKAGDLQFGTYPFINPEQATNPPLADPLPQALVLTAIVIGFALLAYLIALTKKLASRCPDLETGQVVDEEAAWEI
jgi:multicomponent Na+:H+ antiporter subunit C